MREGSWLRASKSDPANGNAAPAPHVVVVGGGAGRRGVAEITLVEKARTHLWMPLPHEVVAASANFPVLLISALPAFMTSWPVSLFERSLACKVVRSAFISQHVAAQAGFDRAAPAFH